MISKLSALFLFLLICQNCMSASVPPTFDEQLQELVKGFDQDKMLREINKLLDDGQKATFDNLVNDVKSAKSVDEALNGAMQLLTFGTELAVNQTKPLLTPSTTPPRP